LREFADVTAHVIDGELSISYCPLLLDDPKVRRSDITRGTELPGWER